MSVDLCLLNLPDIALENILSFLTYDEIAKDRLVCRKFDEIAGNMLSRGFFQMEKRSTMLYKKFKSMLPRRESERKLHPLSRHCDILSALDTRISMMNMTYAKYMENNLICFIPGKVLDEIQNILNVVESGVVPPRTHELLQELRDISSMAIEHFDEQIVPNLLKMHNPQTRSSVRYSPTLKLSKLFSMQTSEMRKVRKRDTQHRQQVLNMHQQIQKLTRKVKRQSIRLKAQNKKLREYDSKITDTQAKVREQESTIAEFKKKTEEWDQKFVDFTAEMNRMREETQKCLNASKRNSNYSLKLDDTAKRNVKNDEKLYDLSNQALKARIPYVSILPLETKTLTEALRKRQSSLQFDLPNKIQKCNNKTTNEDITNIINDNITKNISKTITEKFVPKPSVTNSLFKRPDFSSFLTTSIETLLKNPITNIKSRKRKISEIAM